MEIQTRRYNATIGLDGLSGSELAKVREMIIKIVQANVDLSFIVTEVEPDAAINMVDSEYNYKI